MKRIYLPGSLCSIIFHYTLGVSCLGFPFESFFSETCPWCKHPSLGETMSLVGDFDIAHAHDWMTCKAMVQCKNSHGTLLLHKGDWGSGPLE